MVIVWVLWTVANVVACSCFRLCGKEGQNLLYCYECVSFFFLLEISLVSNNLAFLA